MTDQKKSNFFVRVGAYVSDCFKELRYKVTWPTKKELSSSAVPVSYTHLDVYKRQPLTNATSPVL